MIETTIVNENHKEFNVFNEKSGQQYKIIYTIDQENDNYMIKVVRKHIIEENDKVLADYDMISDINLNRYLFNKSIRSFSSMRFGSESEFYQSKVRMMDLTSEIFAKSLSYNDDFCLGIISAFKDSSYKMQEKAIETLIKFNFQEHINKNKQSKINNPRTIENNDSKMQEEIDKAKEYIKLIKNNNM